MPFLTYVVDYEPAWSPDGSTIAFVSLRGGVSQLFTIRADGTAILCSRGLGNMSPVAFASPKE